MRPRQPEVLRAVRDFSVWGSFKTLHRRENAKTGPPNPTFCASLCGGTKKSVTKTTSYTEGTRGARISEQEFELVGGDRRDLTYPSCETSKSREREITSWVPMAGGQEDAGREFVRSD